MISFIAVLKDNQKIIKNSPFVDDIFKDINNLVEIVNDLNEKRIAASNFKLPIAKYKNILSHLKYCNENSKNFPFAISEIINENNFRMFFDIENIPTDKPNMIYEIIDKLVNYYDLPTNYTLTFNKYSVHELSYHLFFPISTNRCDILNLIFDFHYQTQNKYINYFDLLVYRYFQTLRSVYSFKYTKENIYDSYNSKDIINIDGYKHIVKTKSQKSKSDYEYTFYNNYHIVINGTLYDTIINDYYNLPDYKCNFKINPIIYINVVKHYNVSKSSMYLAEIPVYFDRQTYNLKSSLFEKRLFNCCHFKDLDDYIEEKGINNNIYKINIKWNNNSYLHDIHIISKYDICNQTDYNLTKLQFEISFASNLLQDLYKQMTDDEKNEFNIKYKLIVIFQLYYYYQFLCDYKNMFDYFNNIKHKDNNTTICDNYKIPKLNLVRRKVHYSKETKFLMKNKTPYIGKIKDKYYYDYYILLIDELYENNNLFDKVYYPENTYYNYKTKYIVLSPTFYSLKCLDYDEDIKYYGFENINRFKRIALTCMNIDFKINTKNVSLVYCNINNEINGKKIKLCNCKLYSNIYCLFLELCNCDIYKSINIKCNKLFLYNNNSFNLLKDIKINIDVNKIIIYVYENPFNIETNIYKKYTNVNFINIRKVIISVNSNMNYLLDNYYKYFPDNIHKCQSYIFNHIYNYYKDCVKQLLRITNFKLVIRMTSL